jgi:hypothetical protein
VFSGVKVAVSVGIKVGMGVSVGTSVGGTEGVMVGLSVVVGITGMNMVGVVSGIKWTQPAMNRLITMTAVIIRVLFACR